MILGSGGIYFTFCYLCRGEGRDRARNFGERSTGDQEPLPVLTNPGNPFNYGQCMREIRAILFLQLERYRENCSWHSHTGTSDKFPYKARYSFQKTLIDIMWRRMRYRPMSDNFENCLVKLY